jgi:hypothetical protein
MAISLPEIPPAAAAVNTAFDWLITVFATAF